MSIAPESISSAEAFGTPTVQQSGPVIWFWDGDDPNQGFGIQPKSRIGVFQVTTGLVSVSPSSIDTVTEVSTQIFVGVPPTIDLDGEGIASEEAFGTPTALRHIRLSPTAYTEAVGTPTIEMEYYHLRMHGLRNDNEFGTPYIRSGITPTGIPSAEKVPQPRITRGGVGFAGIPSQTEFGTLFIRKEIIAVANITAGGFQLNPNPILVFTPESYDVSGFAVCIGGGASVVADSVENTNPPGYGSAACTGGGRRLTIIAANEAPIFEASANVYAGGSAISAVGTRIPSMSSGTATIAAGGSSIIAEAVNSSPSIDSEVAVFSGGSKVNSRASFSINRTASAVIQAGGSDIAIEASAVKLFRILPTQIRSGGADIDIEASQTRDYEASAAVSAGGATITSSAKFRGFYFNPLASQRIAMDQTRGGETYPFMDDETDADVLANIFDLYIAHEEEFKYPLKLTYVYGLGEETPNSPEVGFPEGNHRYDLIITDANDEQVIDTTQAETFHLGTWVDRLHVAEWSNGRTIVRAVFRHALSDNDSEEDYPEYVYPDLAEIQPRCVERLGKTITTLTVDDLIATTLVELSEGYNVQITKGTEVEIDGQRRKTQLRIAGSIGRGLGKYPTCDEVDALYFINQVGPSDKGSFFLNGDACRQVKIPTDYLSLDDFIITSNNTIEINGYCVPCRDCNQLVDLYKAKLDAWNRLKELANRLRSLKARFQDVIDKYNEHIACRRNDPITITSRAYCPCRVSLGVSYCNLGDSCIDDIRLDVFVEFSNGAQWSLVDHTMFVNDGETAALSPISKYEDPNQPPLSTNILSLLTPTLPGRWQTITDPPGSYELNGLPDGTGPVMALFSDIATLPGSYSLLVEFTIKDGAANNAFFVFDYVDAGNWKYAGASADDDTWIIGSGDNSGSALDDPDSVVDWSDDSKSIDVDQRYFAKLTIAGARATVTIDGEFVADFTFTSISPTNQIGFGTVNGKVQVHSMVIVLDDDDLPTETRHRISRTLDKIYPGSSLTLKYDILGSDCISDEEITAVVSARVTSGGLLLHEKSSSPISMIQPNENGKCS